MSNNSSLKACSLPAIILVRGGKLSETAGDKITSFVKEVARDRNYPGILVLETEPGMAIEVLPLVQDPALFNAEEKKSDE